MKPTYQTKEVDILTGKIKGKFIEMSDNLDRFVRFMRNSVLHHMPEKDGKNFEEKFGAMYDFGKEVMGQKGVLFHPLTKRAGLACHESIAKLKELNDIYKGMEDGEEKGKEPLDTISIELPKDVFDDPESFLKNCPPKLVARTVKYLYFFAVLMNEVYLLEGQIKMAKGDEKDLYARVRTHKM